jgi:excisionase family DNA binding protein
VHVEFYRGVKAIANFLGVHERTAQAFLHDGKIPAKKDGTGTWVLTNLDYFTSLQG